MESYLNWLEKKSGKKILIALLLFITGFLGMQLPNLSIDFEFEKLFPKNDPDTQFYALHRELFGYDNDFIQIILQADTGSVFKEAFLSQADSLQSTIRRLEGVIRVISPLNQKHYVQTPFGLTGRPLLHTKNPYRLREDSIRIFQVPFYAQAFSHDAVAFSMVVQHRHFKHKSQGDRLVKQIQNLTHLISSGKIRVAGKLIAQDEYVRLIQSDLLWFLLGSLALSFTLLIILYRNLRSALLPFLVSILTLIWLFGLMAWLGVAVNILSALLPPILFFISMSDAIHLINGFNRSTKFHVADKIRESVAMVWQPTLLTSVTTVIGFLCLLWINTQPIQVLGIFAALGVLFAYFLTYSAGLLLLHWQPATQKASGFRLPLRWVDTIVRRNIWIYAFFGLTITLAVPGMMRLKVNAFLLEDLPPGTEVRSHFEYADAQFGGSKPFELRIALKHSNRNIWHPEVLKEIHTVQKYLEENYDVSRVQSPVTIFKYLNMANSGGRPNAYQLPKDTVAYERVKRSLSKLPDQLTSPLVTRDGQIARFIGFIPEWGSYETSLRNEKLIRFIEKCHLQHVDFRLTGTTYLIDKSHEALSMNLAIGLFTAIAVIGIFLTLYFRSMRLMFISLLPNLIPLLLLAGTLGALGIDLKITTAIIFTMSFGIAVDDTIHMMSHYLQSRAELPKERMKLTFLYAGSAMVITTLIMVFGFSLFLFSSFGATFYLGLFVCLSLLVAGMTDLLLLPLLLIKFVPHAKKRRQPS